MTEISLRWYRQNGMKANPNKFQFPISLPYTVEKRNFKLLKILPLPRNLLWRISKYLDFNYKKLVLEFCVEQFLVLLWKRDYNKVEKNPGTCTADTIRLLWLWIYTELLTESGTTIVLHSRFICIFPEVFKSTQDMKTLCAFKVFLKSRNHLI